MTIPAFAHAPDPVRVLRENIDLARCVFEFTVQPVPAGQAVGPEQHRAVLSALMQEIEVRGQHYRERTIAAHPAYADLYWPGGTHDVAAARSAPWDTGGLAAALAHPPGYRADQANRSRTAVSPSECLFQAFHYPPHGARCPPGLFADFCTLTGLLPGQSIEVLDWVGSGGAECYETPLAQEQAQRSQWSDYFDAGQEWWGIWCLTVWNPQRGTLAALVASATD